jgi:hypothetical protein
MAPIQHLTQLHPQAAVVVVDSLVLVAQEVQVAAVLEMETGLVALAQLIKVLLVVLVQLIKTPAAVVVLVKLVKQP